MVKQIKVSDNTYDFLLQLKTNDDTFNSIIKELIYENTRLKKENYELRKDKENLMEILKNFKC